MNKTPLTQHELFWLASHTHNVLQPLIAAAQQYDPTTRLKIEMQFGSDHILAGSLSLSVYQGNTNGGVTSLANEWVIRDKAEVQPTVTKIQAFIDAEQAKIEERHDLEVFYNVAEDTEAEARDWELQQDRIRERADIERAEHDHDIELQNIAAGN